MKRSVREVSSDSDGRPQCKPVDVADIGYLETVYILDGDIQCQSCQLTLAIPTVISLV